MHQQRLQRKHMAKLVWAYSIWVSCSVGSHPAVCRIIAGMTKADDNELKRDGRVKRKTVLRESSAECRECDYAWEGPTAIGAASGHTMSTGHTTYAAYAAAYEYSPNYNEDEHLPYGRAKKRIAELKAQGLDEGATLRKDGAHSGSIYEGAQDIGGA